MKKLFFMIAFLCSIQVFAQQNRVKVEEIIGPQLNGIIQTALDLAELQPYYHAKNNVISKQVVFEEEAPFTAKYLNALSKFNKPVLVLNHSEIAKQKVKKYLSIHDWDITMNDCRLELNFNGEKILISYTLRKTNNKWVITGFKIVPQK